MMRRAQAIDLGACLCLGGVFVLAGAAKILDPVAFYHAIRDHHLLPPALARAMAWWLPWLEVCTALALAVPRARSAAATILGLLALGFLAINLLALARDTGATCSCFGALATIPAAAILILDAVLGLLALILLRPRRRPPLTDPPGDP